MGDRHLRCRIFQKQKRTRKARARDVDAVRRNHCLPIFSIRNASGVMRLPLPATSIFTIDKQTEKFVSVHNMFDIAKVYGALQSST